MKAVNLIPSDNRRSRGGLKAGSLGPAHGLLALLGVAVLFVSIYVLTSNTISDRTTKLAGLKVQVAQAQAEAARLATYTSFEQMAQQRSATVREIIASRFDWDKALSELSRVVPADTSLQSLLGTVVPGVSIGSSSGGASTGTLRSTISAPAFEIRGCTKNQDEVAGVMSRLRLINGVTRVTLSDSQKTSSASGSVSPSSGSSSGCPARWPTFDLVVFFTPVPNAGAQGVASGSGSATPVPGASTPVATTTTTPTGTVATTSTTPGSSQPVTSTTSTTSTSGGTK